MKPRMAEPAKHDSCGKKPKAGSAHNIDLGLRKTLMREIERKAVFDPSLQNPDKAERDFIEKRSGTPETLMRALQVVRRVRATNKKRGITF